MMRSASDTLYSGQEHHLQLFADGRITVERLVMFLHLLMNLMMTFARWVRGRSLARKREGPWGHDEIRVVAQLAVEDHYPQRVQELPFVFVNALDLAILDRVRVDDDPEYA